MTDYHKQYLAIRIEELAHFNRLRAMGAVVPQEITDGLAKECDDLAEHIRLMGVFFPEFDEEKLEKLLSEP